LHGSSIFHIKEGSFRAKFPGYNVSSTKVSHPTNSREFQLLQIIRYLKKEIVCTNSTLKLNSKYNSASTLQSKDASKKKRE